MKASAANADTSSPPVSPGLKGMPEESSDNAVSWPRHPAGMAARVDMGPELAMPGVDKYENTPAQDFTTKAGAADAQAWTGHGTAAAAQHTATSAARPLLALSVIWPQRCWTQGRGAAFILSSCLCSTLIIDTFRLANLILLSCPRLACMQVHTECRHVVIRHRAAGACARATAACRCVLHSPGHGHRS